MLPTALSATLVGLQAHAVRVEVEATRGPPFFELVGLAEAAVRESRVRVKSALGALGAAPREAIDGVLFVGELSLEGLVQPVRGEASSPSLREALTAGRNVSAGFISPARRVSR